MVCANPVRRCLGLTFIALLIPAAALAADRKAAKVTAPAETLEMFRAIEDGQIAVRLIPKDYTQATLFVTNKTKQPLNVQLPAAFAGVPALAQWPAMPAPQTQQPADPNANQRVALMPDPFGNAQQRPGQNQRNGLPQLRRGQFNIPPEAVGKIKLVSLCLDHGKPSPRPAVPYAIRPLESVTTDATMTELCAMLGRNEVARQVAQLGAWHLANSLSWESLAAERDPGLFGGTPRYNRADIEAARKAVTKAGQLIKERSPSSGATVGIRD